MKAAGWMVIGWTLAVANAEARPVRPSAVMTSQGPSWREVASARSRMEAPSDPVRGVVTQAASVNDPPGDTFGEGAERADITLLSAEVAGTDLQIEMEFAGGVSPADSGRADALGGVIDLDVDQNGATGAPSSADFVGGGLSGLGVELTIDLFGHAGGRVPVLDAETETEIGTADALFGASSVRLLVPLTVLDDDGQVNLAAVVGTLAEPTDVAPNSGSVSSSPPATSVLLNRGRFHASVRWRRPPARPEQADALVSDLRTEDSGIFYFLEPSNLELMVKVLDACPFNDRFWVFFAATTDVEFTLTVTDTVSGAVRAYENPLGQPANAVTDTSAFATCP